MQKHSRDLMRHKTKILLFTRSKLLYNKPSSSTTMWEESPGSRWRSKQFILSRSRKVEGFWAKDDSRCGLWRFPFFASAKWKRSGVGGGEENLIPVWNCLQVQGSWGPTQRIGTHPIGTTGREMILENNLEYHAKCLDCVLLSAVGNPMAFKWGLDW